MIIMQHLIFFPLAFHHCPAQGFGCRISRSCPTYCRCDEFVPYQHLRPSQNCCCGLLFGGKHAKSNQGFSLAQILWFFAEFLSQVCCFSFPFFLARLRQLLLPLSPLLDDIYYRHRSSGPGWTDHEQSPRQTGWSELHGPHVLHQRTGQHGRHWWKPGRIKQCAEIVTFPTEKIRMIVLALT